MHKKISAHQKKKKERKKDDQVLLVLMIMQHCFFFIRASGPGELGLGYDIGSTWKKRKENGNKAIQKRREERNISVIKWPFTNLTDTLYYHLLIPKQKFKYCKLLNINDQSKSHWCKAEVGDHYL